MMRQRRSHDAIGDLAKAVRDFNQAAIGADLDAIEAAQNLAMLDDVESHGVRVLGGQREYLQFTLADAQENARWYRRAAARYQRRLDRARAMAPA